MIRTGHFRALIAALAMALTASSVALVGPLAEEAQTQTAPPPGLGGTAFNSTNPADITVTGACDETLTSTLGFRSSGVATGGYPGTFTETGTITLGPRGSSGQQPILALTTDFAIDSPNGQVTGTKRFVAGSTDNGNCQQLFDGRLRASASTQNNLRYTATIETPSGRTCTTAGPAIMSFFKNSAVVSDRFSARFSEYLPIVPPTCEDEEPQDSTAPATSAATSPEPNAAGWHKEDVTVTLNAADEDDGSGVEGITYLATGAQEIASETVAGDEAEFLITNEGETTITYSATDNAGNTAEEKTLTVRLDETAPVLDLENVTADATSPEGAEVSYSAPATDNLDPEPEVECAPPLGSLFPIGVTDVDCTAEDVAGNAASASFEVKVKGAQEQIDDLAIQIESFDLNGGIERSLLAKLQDANCGKLGALIDQAEDLSGEKLTAEQARELTSAAARIQEVLDC